MFFETQRPIPKKSHPELTTVPGWQMLSINDQEIKRHAPDVWDVLAKSNFPLVANLKCNKTDVNFMYNSNRNHSTSYVNDGVVNIVFGKDIVELEKKGEVSKGVLASFIVKALANPGKPEILQPKLSNCGIKKINSHIADLTAWSSALSDTRPNDVLLQQIAQSAQAAYVNIPFTQNARLKPCSTPTESFLKTNGLQPDLLQPMSPRKVVVPPVPLAAQKLEAPIPPAVGKKPEGLGEKRGVNGAQQKKEPITDNNLLRQIGKRRRDILTPPLPRPD